jgi:hypothetical protein
LKASFFILYLHLFDSLLWARVCSWIGLCVISIIHITIAAYSLAIASPYNSNWKDKALNTGVSSAILGLVVDIVILVIPIIAVGRLQKLSVKKKLAALAVFITGAW